jgi:hypothetical protein
MDKKIRRIIAFLAALSVTSLAISLSIASAGQRTTKPSDRELLAAVGVVIVLAVHLLPALLHRRQRFVMWPVWALCFCLAGYGHATWFYFNAESVEIERQKADEVRQAGSAPARAMAQERTSIEQALSTIRARPVAIVAAQLSRTSVPERRESLALELAEAQRAAGLRDRLVVVSRGTLGSTVTKVETAGNLGKTWSVTGGREDITLVTSVVAALLVELLGALLWAAVLRDDANTENVAQSVSADALTVEQQLVTDMALTSSSPVRPAVKLVDDELPNLRAAIARGDCKNNIRAIRKYVGCRMETAMHLKRALDAVQ